METNHVKLGLSVIATLLSLLGITYCVTWKTTSYIDIHSGTLLTETEAFAVTYQQETHETGFSRFVAQHQLRTGTPQYEPFSSSKIVKQSHISYVYGGPKHDLDAVWSRMEDCDCEIETKVRFIKELLHELPRNPSNIGKIVQKLSNELCVFD